MAKTVIVEFDVFNVNELPKGVTLSDVVSVPRSYEIYRYFAEHFDVSVLDIEIEKGCVTNLHVDGLDRRSLPVRDAVPTILEWAKALPEMVIYIRTEGDPDGLYESPYRIQRSTLESSLPALLDVLQTQDNYGFVVDHGILVSDELETNASEPSECVADLLLDGRPVSKVLFKMLNLRLSECGLSQSLENKLSEKNVLYVAELATMTEKDFLAMPNTGKKTLTAANELLGSLDHRLKVGITLEGWTRPETM